MVACCFSEVLGVVWCGVVVIVGMLARSLIMGEGVVVSSPWWSLVIK